MSYEKRENTGTLGRNKRKEKDTHPDFSGSLNVEGDDFWLSGWVKENKDTGERFFSLSVKRKDNSPAVTAKPSQAPAKTEPNDDIPF